MAALTSRAKIAGTSLALFCLSLFLTAYSARNPKVAQIGAAAIGEILHPVQSVNKGVQSGISGVIDHYFWLLNVKQENQTLTSRLRELESENSRLKELFSENLRLKELLGVTERTSLNGVASDVIGYSASNWVQSVTLNKGALHGLKRGMPVLDGSGVVGQVSAAGATSSQVLLISDHTSGVDAIIQDSRARGLVEGASRFLQLRYVASDEVVKVGDRVITSGMDGVFPKGMLIGIVSHVSKRPNSLFQEIQIKPAVKFSRLETVLVVTSAIEIDKTDVEEKVEEKTSEETEEVKAGIEE